MCWFNHLRATKTRRQIIKGVIKGALICLLIVLFANFSLAETDITEDVTEKIELVKLRLMYDRLNKVSYFDVSLKNISQDVLPTPIKVIIDNLTPSTVTVVNADGTTESGKPYFEYNYPFIEKGQLDSTETTPVKRFKFNNPYAQRFNYTAKIMVPLPTPGATIERATTALDKQDIDSFILNIPSYEQNSMKEKLSQFGELELQQLSNGIRDAVMVEQSDTNIKLEYTFMLADGTERTIHFRMIFIDGAWKIAGL